MPQNDSIGEDVEGWDLVVLFWFEFLKDRSAGAFEVSVRLIVAWCGHDLIGGELRFFLQGN